MVIISKSSKKMYKKSSTELINRQVPCLLVLLSNLQKKIKKTPRCKKEGTEAYSHE